MAWSGALALATPLWLGGRVLKGLRHAPVPLEARLPVALAILNFYVAAGLGVMLGIHKHQPFLPFTQLDGVHAHVHLAAVGFAALLVVGVGYRVLPMVLPAAMPRGPLALASGLVLPGGRPGPRPGLPLREAARPGVRARHARRAGALLLACRFHVAQPPPCPQRAPATRLGRAPRALGARLSRDHLRRGPGARLAPAVGHDAAARLRLRGIRVSRLPLPARDRRRGAPRAARGLAAGLRRGRLPRDAGVAASHAVSRRRRGDVRAVDARRLRASPSAWRSTTPRGRRRVPAHWRSPC